jgi:hypothetical protein
MNPFPKNIPPLDETKIEVLKRALMAKALEIESAHANPDTSAPRGKFLLDEARVKIVNAVHDAIADKKNLSSQETPEIVGKAVYNAATGYFRSLDPDDLKKCRNQIPLVGGR